MIKLKKVLLPFFISILFVQYVTSQTKIGHINTQELIMSMPEMNIIQSELEKLLKEYSKEYTFMEKTVKSKNDQYLSEYDSQTEEINKTRNEEIRSSLLTINEFKKEIQILLNKKETELIKPIKDKVNEAIIKVSKEKGFNYVLDSTNGQGLLFTNGEDLMSDVKVELGF